MFNNISGRALIYIAAIGFAALMFSKGVGTDWWTISALVLVIVVVITAIFTDV